MAARFREETMKGVMRAGAVGVPRDKRRRRFLQTIGMASLGTALGTQTKGTSAESAISPPVPSSRSGEIPRRPLGRTGAEVSALGCGGHHLGDIKEVDEALRLIHAALDAGVTFFDN